MEIHPPHGAAHSWKDLLIQLATITAGILIALSFEGLREWRHERVLVREARENLQREIADNRKEVDNEIAAAEARGKKIETALQFANEMITSGKSSVNQIELSLNFPSLSAASWHTADRTGAFSHMDYAEVQKYERVYTIQELLAAQHRRALDALADSLGIITAVEGGDPTKASRPEIERFREHLVRLRAVLFVEDQLSRQTSAVYKRALE